MKKSVCDERAEKRRRKPYVSCGRGVREHTWPILDDVLVDRLDMETSSTSSLLRLSHLPEFIRFGGDDSHGIVDCWF